MGAPAAQVPVDEGPVPQLDLSRAIASITDTTKLYTESNLPPSLPTPHKRWVPRLSPPAPHEPHSYFPMSLYQ